MKDASNYEPHFFSFIVLTVDRQVQQMLCAYHPFLVAMVLCSNSVGSHCQKFWFVHVCVVLVVVISCQEKQGIQAFVD